MLTDCMSNELPTGKQAVEVAEKILKKAKKNPEDEVKIVGILIEGVGFLIIPIKSSETAELLQQPGDLKPERVSERWRNMGGFLRRGLSFFAVIEAGMISADYISNRDLSQVTQDLPSFLIYGAVAASILEGASRFLRKR